jgi:hypothetical protein
MTPSHLVSIEESRYAGRRDPPLLILAIALASSLACSVRLPSALCGLHSPEN